MSEIARHVSLDPLNPPTDIVMITIIQYKNERGQIVQDVQSHLMKDLRNEEFIFHMIEQAKGQLKDWFKHQKELRKIR